MNMAIEDGDYAEGSAKYDPATKALAVRTDQPLVNPNPMARSIAWNIAAPRGSFYGGADSVDGWQDIPPEILDRLTQVTAKLDAVVELLDAPDES